MTTWPANARLCHRCGQHFIGRACPKCPPLANQSGNHCQPSRVATAGQSGDGGKDRTPALASAPPAAPNSYDNQTDRAGEAAKLERNSGNGPLAKSEAEKGNPERVLVRVTSVRKRLIDEDNLAEKYHVDCCRYAGLIHGDEPSKTKIEVCQRKAAKDEAEHTIIEITTP
jgi:hypothetical protein